MSIEGRYKETIESCYNPFEGGMELKNYKSILTAYLNLAASHYCIGDIDAAFTNLESYEEICDKHGDEIDWLSSYNILFLLHDYYKDFGKAKNTLKKSIALSKKMKIFLQLKIFIYYMICSNPNFVNIGFVY